MSQWSVEVRLCMTLVFNGFLFIVAKSISNQTNFDILSLMSMSAQTVNTPENVESPKPFFTDKPLKMKGPNISSYNK